NRATVAALALPSVARGLQTRARHVARRATTTGGSHLNVERCALNSLPWTLSELNVFFIMRRAIYPGSFDPVTNGHLDVIERARKLCDEVIVAVAHNDEKQPLFSLKDRLDLLRETAGKIDNVRIAEFDGLLIEFAKKENAGAVIR